MNGTPTLRLDLRRPCWEPDRLVSTVLRLWLALLLLRPPPTTMMLSQQLQPRMATMPLPICPRTRDPPIRVPKAMVIILPWVYCWSALHCVNPKNHRFFSSSHSQTSTSASSSHHHRIVSIHTLCTKPTYNNYYYNNHHPHLNS